MAKSDEANRFLADRNKLINPIYENTIGTESWERKKFLDIIAQKESKYRKLVEGLGKLKKYGCFDGDMNEFQYGDFVKDDDIEILIAEIEGGQDDEG